MSAKTAHAARAPIDPTIPPPRWRSQRASGPPKGEARPSLLIRGREQRFLLTKLREDTAVQMAGAASHATGILVRCVRVCTKGPAVLFHFELRDTTTPANAAPSFDGNSGPSPPASAALLAAFSQRYSLLAKVYRAVNSLSTYPTIRRTLPRFPRKAPLNSIGRLTPDVSASLLAARAGALAEYLEGVLGSPTLLSVPTVYAAVRLACQLDEDTLQRLGARPALDLSAGGGGGGGAGGSSGQPTPRPSHPAPSATPARQTQRPHQHLTLP